MDTPVSARCPKCGATLPADAPRGLCPRCLAAMNLETETVLTRQASVPAQPPLTPAELQPHFPQLEIFECLGRGGMGVVYKARQKSLNRTVALKLLAPERVRDAAFGERFAREAQALAKLNHPNIVTVHDFGQAGGYFYLLMEFVDGVNLRQLLRARKLLPAEALAIVPPVCEALQYAHDHGIVHRDIKPENLLLDKEGRVKIADFGIAKILGAEAAGAGASTEAAGTPRYMAPEQVTNSTEADHRADIYSLGVVLYEMLTGELPSGRIVPPSRKVLIDVRLDEVVLRALETKPELRYQQAAEFKTQVETIATSSAREPRSPEPNATPGGPLPHNLLKAFGCLLTVLAIPVGALGIFFLLALFDEGSNWHPGISEAVIVALTWLGCLLLPLGAWLALRGGGFKWPIRRQAATQGGGWLISSTGVAVLALLGLTAAAMIVGAFAMIRAEQVRRAESARAAALRAQAEARWRFQQLKESPSPDQTNDQGAAEIVPDDIRDVPILDRLADGDEKKRYLLIGHQGDRAAPARGYRLLLVLPGGDGSADFSPFVRRIYKNALDEKWLIAQLIAPSWDQQQKRRLVWPTAADNYPGAKFSTEQFVETVVADIRKQHPLDGIFTLAWSSGGPAAYAVSLHPGTPVTGSLIAMSIFRSEQMTHLENASGQAFYLLQSPDDKLTRFEHAERAEATLTRAGAKVRLQSYAGGHGWRGNVYGNIRAGVEWLTREAKPASDAREQ